MTDCQNVTMREALPELLHGRLADGERRLVEAHLVECVDCTDELAILEAVLASAPTPAVDVTRIAMAIPSYRAVADAESQVDSRSGVIPMRPRAGWASDWSSRSARLQLAAALAIAAAGVSTIAVVKHNGAQQHASVAAVGAAATTRADQGVALVATADLSDAELATLIKDMDSMQALPPAEPEPIAPAVDGGV